MLGGIVTGLQEVEPVEVQEVRLERYDRTQDVLDDLVAGRRIYLRGELIDPEEIMRSRAKWLWGMVKDGYVERLKVRRKFQRRFRPVGRYNRKGGERA